MVGAIIGGVAALGSAITGAISSSKQNKRSRDLIGAQRTKNQQWYNTRMAEDFTQRTDAQAILKKQREMLEERYNNARATGAVSGATDEAVALQKEAANSAMADTMTNLSAQAASYKENVENAYHNTDSALNQQQAQIATAQAQASAQASAQAVNAGLNLIGADLSNTSAPQKNNSSSPEKRKS